MGLIADVLGGARTRNVIPVPIPSASGGLTGEPMGQPANYNRLAGSYSRNEIVYAAVELLASSAAEPHINGRRWRRNSPGVSGRQAINTEKRMMAAKGLSAINARLVKNGYVEEQPGHPLVQLLNNPNPWMSRGQFWGTAVMDRSLAGNFYAVKARPKNFPKAFPIELWRLRPDRVKIVPSKDNFIEAYEYGTGADKMRFEPKDVLHWKTRNPWNDYYGMPPLMPLMGRLDIDWYMQSFLRGFYESGGSGPGAILSVKTRLSQDQKEEVRSRYKRRFGMPAGAFELMILDQAESSYQQLGLNRGLRDALPKELDAVSEARIAMVFGIPGSILGLLIGYESSSYANKRQDWQVLWDVTMTPLLSDLDDVLNLSLLPEFKGIDEVYFDLDDIKALQEDVDKVQDRHRKNFATGITSFEETRDAMGYDPGVNEGMFYVPSNVQPTPFSELGETPEPALVPAPGLPETATALLLEARCHQCNRLLGRDVRSARFDCPRCKAETVVDEGVALQA